MSKYPATASTPVAVSSTVNSRAVCRRACTRKWHVHPLSTSLIYSTSQTIKPHGIPTNHPAFSGIISVTDRQSRHPVLLRDNPGFSVGIRGVARGVSWLPGNPPFASWSWERSRQRTTCVITNRRSDSIEKYSHERKNKKIERRCRRKHTCKLDRRIYRKAAKITNPIKGQH